MLFNSLEFALFFAIVYATYRVLSHRGQNLFLLVASYLFYAAWDYRFLSLIVVSTLVDFYCGKRIHQNGDPRARAGVLAVSLICNLGILGFFKYFDFFAVSLRAVFASIGVQVDDVTLDIVLPVGISFYTFQTLSYTIDVYRRQLVPEPRLENFALFVAFFPQLVAGPIERASRLLPQIREPRCVQPEDLTRGLAFVLFGLYLKVVVADNLAPIADAAFDVSAEVDSVDTLLGTYAFAFQIFGDFAGYSWIAIGVARLLGFRLMTNFLYPYAVRRPRDFWRNWHISLSTWLRDYLYIPLGGNRGTRAHLYRNLMVTMLLGGLWHGAAWTFVVWGAFHGSLLIADHATGPKQWFAHRRSVTLDFARWLVAATLMFHVTCLGWLIFRAPSLDRLAAMSAGVVTRMHWPTEAQVFGLLQVAFYAAVVIGMHLAQAPGLPRPVFWTLPRPVKAIIAAGLLYSVVIFGQFGASPFIYFQF